MIIDLRSDTVTKPTKPMLEAMMKAEVGDDVFGEDPTITKLEEKCAAMFGMDHAVYCPSGTMTNQIGINILTNHCDEVICYEGSHIYKYEGGGAAGNSGLSFKLLKGDRGKLSVQDIEENINADDIHFPATTLVELENTVNKAGGSCYTLDEIAKISELCRNKGLKLHLDGARVFNALVATGDNAAEYGKHFDTISICLSKGLGAPVGSVLLVKKELEKKARRMRKVFGGGMRQGGYLAAAGIYALDNHLGRLREDHLKAEKLAEALQGRAFVEEVLPVETNIVIFKLAGGQTSVKFLEILKSHGILAVPFGKHEIRFVTHLDFDDDMLEKTIRILREINY
ncbi:MAG: threonine aldolase family protein [Candidatus Cyclobacteriaceae bacterium M2_1C_046]